MGMKPATTERTSPPHEHKSLFSSENLEEETNRAGGGRKQRKAKGKSYGTELSRKASKKGARRTRRTEEQTNNQNAEAKDSWPVNCRKLTLGLNPQWRRQD
jgi:hypothetical protein